MLESLVGEGPLGGGDHVAVEGDDAVEDVAGLADVSLPVTTPSRFASRPRVAAM